VSLAEVELLTIRIGCSSAQSTKAEQIGLDWWKYDHHLSPGKQALSAENDNLRKTGANARAAARVTDAPAVRADTPVRSWRAGSQTDTRARHKECPMPVERAPGGASLIDVLDPRPGQRHRHRRLGPCLAGRDRPHHVEARIVVASIETY
jgi:hypothetical protein